MFRGRRVRRKVEAAARLPGERQGLPEGHVTVVDVEDLVGPHHRHPNGEVCMIMPAPGGARFDGHGAGWLVYDPATAHRPTVSGGQATVLYMLPDGCIEFTRT